MELELSSLRSDPNLLSYFRFEGNSNDSQGGVNGTDTSITYGVSYGKFGQGASFNGTNSKIVNTSGVSGVEGQSAISFGGWFYTNTISMPPSGQRVGLAQGSRAGLSEQVCQIKISNTATTVLVGTLLSNREWSASQSSVPPINTWRFIVGTYDSTNLKLYINGELVTTTAAAGGNTNTPNSTNDSLHIGHIGITSETDYGDFWSGYIDDCFFFNRALTPDEIYELYSGSVGGFTSIRII